MTVLLFAIGQAADEPLTPSTPIVAAAGGLITANADGPANLLGSLHATLTNPNGTVAVPAVQVTISETEPLDGDLWRYTARLVAPLTAGSYTIAWQGPESTQTASEPVIVTVGVKPGMAEVAALIRARTKGTGGTELGTFTSLTRPTDTEADLLIDDAVDEVLGKVQPIDATLPPGEGFNAPGGDYERRIRRAAALYAAILIELSYFPEQVRSGQSPAATYQELYKSRIEALIAEGETGRPEGEGAAGGAGDAPADAAWGGFPADNGLVGWATRF